MTKPYLVFDTRNVLEVTGGETKELDLGRTDVVATKCFG